MTLQNLVNAALGERADADYRYAKADRLKAAAIAEAERLRARGGAVRELSSDQGLGTLRLDGANKPAVPVVDKPDETSSWLAQVAPALVTASIRVPVERLAEALEVLDFAGINGPAVSAKVESRDPQETGRWLRENCVVQADPQVPRAWNVLYRDAEGHLTPVPGTSAVQPVPSWKLTVAADLKARYTATGVGEADELVQQLRQDDAAQRTDPAGEGGHEPYCTDQGHRDGEYSICETPDGDGDDRPQTLEEQLEERMAAGDPVAAAAHATLVQGGYSTPEIEAERMAADRARASGTAAATEAVDAAGTY